MKYSADYYAKSVKTIRARQGTVLCLDIRSAFLYDDTGVIPYSKPVALTGQAVGIAAALCMGRKISE